MTARVCTCIRKPTNPRAIEYPDDDCTAHAATRADLDARRTAAALGRLIRAAAWLYIALVLWVSIGADHLTPLHWTALAAATPLSLWLTTTSKETP